MLGSVFNRTRHASGNASVHTVLRTFQKNGDAHGYSEFRGTGPPELDYGQPGDIYLDLTPDSMTLYARHPNDWKAWSGPDNRTDLVLHPEHRDRCLWCNGESYGWYTINISGSKGQGKTQSEVLAAAREKATTKSRQGQKRRLHSAEGDQSNKRVQLSTSSTPPPVNPLQTPTQTQRLLSASHEVPPAFLQRSTASQPQDPGGWRFNAPRFKSPTAPSSLRTASNKSESPRASGSRLGTTNTNTSSTQPVAGPSRIVNHPEALVDSPISNDSDEEDELQEVDELADPDCSPGTTNTPTASHPLPRPRTPLLDEALAHFSVVLNGADVQMSARQFEKCKDGEQYSSTTIASYVKPLLQELVRLQHAETQATRTETTLREAMERLRSAAYESEREAAALTRALADAQMESRVCAAQVAQTLEELSVARKIAQELAEAKEELARLRRQADLDSARLSLRARDKEELQQSVNVKAALVEQAREEVDQLRRTAAVDTRRIKDGEREIEELKVAVSAGQLKWRKALEHVACLERDGAAAAAHADQAVVEIANLKAGVEGAMQQMRALQDENASLKVVGELYVQATKAVEQLDATAQENATQLQAARDEVSRLKEENAQLRRQEVAQVKTETDMGALSQAVDQKMKQDAHPPAAIVQSTASPSGASFDPVDLLRDIHVQFLCADMGDHLLCRSCLATGLELQHPFKKGATLNDSFRDIYEHHMEEHRENYDIVLSMEDEELRNAYLQLVQDNE